MTGKVEVSSFSTWIRFKYPDGRTVRVGDRAYNSLVDYDISEETYNRLHEEMGLSRKGSVYSVYVDGPKVATTLVKIMLGAV